MRLKTGNRNPRIKEANNILEGFFLKKKSLSILIVVALIMSMFTFAAPAAAEEAGWWDVTSYPVSGYASSVAGTDAAFAGQREITGTLDGEPITMTHYWGWYAENPNNTKQRINIYVPSNATEDSGVYLWTVNSGWTSNNYPAGINSGFNYSTSGANPNQQQLAIARGMVLVTYGARSINDPAAGGEYLGHSPATMTDTKAAIRFVKYNMEYGSILGNPERVAISGSSGGGALTAQLAASGNHPDFYTSLYEIGALGLDYDDGAYINDYAAGDSVFATLSYCPMIDWGPGEYAYEWDIGAYRAKLAAGGYGDTNRGASFILTPWQLKLSADLATKYPAYVATYGITTDDIKSYVAAMVETALERYLSEGNSVSQLEAALRNTTDYKDLALPMDWYTIDEDNNVTFTNYTRFTEYMFFVGQFLKGVPMSSIAGLVSGGYSENRLYGTLEQEWNYPDATMWAMYPANWGEWADDILEDLTTDNEKREAMFNVDGSLKAEAYAAYQATGLTDLIKLQVKMASPIPYLMNADDAALSDTAPYWYVRHGLRDDGVAFATHGLLAYGIANNDKIVSYDHQFKVAQNHGGNYDNLEAFAWLDSAFADAYVEPELDFTALRFDPAKAPDAVVTTGTGANQVVYNVYREFYCLKPVPGLNDGIFMLTFRVPVSIGGIPFDPAKVANAPILYNNPWGGDRGSAAPAANSAASGVALSFLRNGWVTVNVGMRGNADNIAGYMYGKLPNPIVDLKASLRYLHFNDDVMPGDANKIVVQGSSSGGSATVMLGSSGNTTLYEKEMAAIGGLPLSMEGIRDDIWVAEPSCAVMMRGNADPAIAWALFGDLTGAEVGVATSAVNRALSMEFIRYLEQDMKLVAQYDVPEAGIKKGDRLTRYNYAAYLFPNIAKSLMYYLNVQMPNAGDRAAIEAFLNSSMTAANTSNIVRSSFITPIFDENDVLVDIKVTNWNDFWRYNSGLALSYAPLDGYPDPMRTLQFRHDPNAFDSYANSVILDNGVIAPGSTLPVSICSLGRPTDTASIFSAFGIEWQKAKGVTFDQATLDLLEYQRNAVDPMYFLLNKQAGNTSIGDITIAPNWIMRGGSYDPAQPPATMFSVQAKLQEMGYNCDAMMTWDQGHATTNDSAGQLAFVKGLLAEPIPGDPAVTATGPATVEHGKDSTATYKLSMSDMPDVNAVSFTVRIEKAFFYRSGSTWSNVLGGFSLLSTSVWRDDGTFLEFDVVLVNAAKASTADLFELKLYLYNMQDATTAVEFKNVKLAIAGGGGYVPGDFAASVTTEFLKKYSKYDANRDGIVDLLDISAALDAFMAEPGDANWNAAYDVNGDGIIDTLDLVLIRANFTK